MRLVAPAKLTRTLRVLGRRADGLHEVEIEAVHLALADTVDLAPAPATTIDLVAGAPWVDLARVPTDATNLAWRALELIGETGTLAITKRIPVEGGSAAAPPTRAPSSAPSEHRSRPAGTSVPTSRCVSSLATSMPAASASRSWPSTTWMRS